jgi:hypothetical protein
VEAGLCCFVTLLLRQVMGRRSLENVCVPSALSLILRFLSVLMAGALYVLLSL